MSQYRSLGSNIVTRPDYLKLPEWKLPVYPRSAGFSLFGPGEFEEAPPRPFVQLNWCVSGSGTITQDEITWNLTPGSVLFTPPGIRCVNRQLESRWLIRWITFDGPAAAAFWEGYGYARLMLGVGKCPEEMFRRFEDGLRENTVEAMRHNIAVLCEILAAAGGTHADGSREGKLIEEFLALGQRKFCDPETDLNTLCEQMHIHRATLTRIFTPRMQTSPGKYLRGLRIQHALQLLRSSRMPICEIARQAGIRDSGYFSRVIREATGMTPGEYRRSR